MHPCLRAVYYIMLDKHRWNVLDVDYEAWKMSYHIYNTTLFEETCVYRLINKANKK